MKINATKRNYVWVIQKKVGNRWSTITDSLGVVTIRTRKLAREVSREFKNYSKNPRNYRVAKFSEKA